MHEEDSDGDEYADLSTCQEGCCCSAHLHANQCCNAHGQWEMNECCTAHRQWESHAHSRQRGKDAMPAEWGDRFHKLRKLWSGHCCELQPYRRIATSNCKGCANCCGTTNTLANMDTRDSSRDNCHVIPNSNREESYVQECPCFMEKCVPLRECACWKRIANDCKCQCRQQPEEYQLLAPKSSTGEELSETNEDYPDEQPDCSCVSSREVVLLEGTDSDCCGGVLQMIEDCNPKNITYPACAYSCDCIGRNTQRLRRTGPQDHRNGTPRWPRKDPLLSRRSMSVQLLDTRCRINHSDVPYDEVLVDECHISLRPKISRKQSSRREVEIEESPNPNENEGNEVEENAPVEKESKSETVEGGSVENLNDEVANAEGMTEEGSNDWSKHEEKKVTFMDSKEFIDQSRSSETEEKKVTFIDSKEFIDQSLDEIRNTSEETNNHEKSEDPESSDALYLYHNKDLFSPSSSVIIPKKVESDTEISTLSPPTPPFSPPNQVQCLCEKIHKGTSIAKQARDSILVHLKKKAAKTFNKVKPKPTVEEARDSILVHKKKKDKKISKGNKVADEARDSILVQKKKKSKNRVSYNLEKKQNSSDLTEESVATRNAEVRGRTRKKEICGPCGRSRPGSRR